LRDFHSNTRTTDNLYVAELARRARVTPATIRYYARIGLLRPTREPGNDYRCFSTADLQRLDLVRRAKSLGLTISDIQAIMEIIDRGELPSRHELRSLVEQRLASIREQMADLQAIEVRIIRALKLWNHTGYPPAADREFYPLIGQTAGLEGAKTSTSPTLIAHQWGGNGCHIAGCHRKAV